MNAERAVRRGAIDRLTSSVAFRAIFAVAMLLVVPLLVVGAVFTPIFVVGAPAHYWIWVLLPTVGGVLGIAGLIRARRQLGAAAPGRLETTLACLAAGVAAALVPIGVACFAWQDPSTFGPGSWVATAVAAAHLVVVAAAIGWMQRLVRRHTVLTGVRFDPLPLVFLLLAAALALCVATVTVSISETLS